MYSGPLLLRTREKPMGSLGLNAYSQRQSILMSHKPEIPWLCRRNKCEKGSSQEHLSGVLGVAFVGAVWALESVALAKPSQ